MKSPSSTPSRGSGGSASSRASGVTNNGNAGSGSGQSASSSEAGKPASPSPANLGGSVAPSSSGGVTSAGPAVAPSGISAPGENGAARSQGGGNGPSRHYRDRDRDRSSDRGDREQHGGRSRRGTEYGGGNGASTPSSSASPSGGSSSGGNRRHTQNHNSRGEGRREPRGSGGGAAAAATADVAGQGENLSLFGDIMELTKARLTLLVLLTTLAGFYLGLPEGVVSVSTLAHTLFGTALVAAAASALNQYLEREPDARMGRTEDRPLPRARLAAEDVATAAIAAALFGALWLGLLVNWLSSALAVATLLIYVLVYTPLKRITPLNTLVGAVPGAIPPVIGWASARNSVDLQALALFGILFLWQMPHFLAIAWLYREDYSGAGFKMSSLGDHSGARTAGSSVLYSVLLIPVSMAPYFLGTCNIAYAVVACVISIGFTWMCVRFFVFPVNIRARQLFLASIIYLPLLLIAAVLTKNS